MLLSVIKFTYRGFTVLINTRTHLYCWQLAGGVVGTGGRTIGGSRTEVHNLKVNVQLRRGRRKKKSFLKSSLEKKKDPSPPSPYS